MNELQFDYPDRLEISFVIGGRDENEEVIVFIHQSRLGADISPASPSRLNSADCRKPGDVAKMAMPVIAEWMMVLVFITYC